MNIMSLMDYLPPTVIPHSWKNGEPCNHEGMASFHDV